RLRTQRTGFCALGALKANVGHLNAAAGVAGFIKAVLALENAEIPPVAGFEQQNPRIDFASSPFYIPTRATAWPKGAAPRRAAVSGFGLGGTNPHVVLEEAPPAPPRRGSGLHEALVVSARTPGALDRATRALAEHLRAHGDEPL